MSNSIDETRQGVYTIRRIEDGSIVVQFSDWCKGHKKTFKDNEIYQARSWRNKILKSLYLEEWMGN